MESVIFKLRLLFLFTAFSFVLMDPSNSFAQKQKDQGAIQDMETFGIKPVEDKYIPVKIESLAKFYWAIGRFDITDMDAIDNFLKITECDLYQQFIHDDFEWRKIRKGMQEHLQQNASQFPVHFEMIIPVSLGRYDPEKEVFEVVEESQIDGARRFDVRNVDHGPINVCVDRGYNIPDYDIWLYLVLGRPFSFREILVSPELADLYIEDAKLAFENLPPDLRIKQYERVAYLRLKIRFSAFKESVSDERGNKRAVVLGELEGYEVYADSDKYKMLYQKEFEDKRRIRRRRNSAADDNSDDQAE